MIKKTFPVILRRMKEEDIPEIVRLGRAEESSGTGEVIGWPDFWSKEILETWFNKPKNILLVAQGKGQIIGFLVVVVHQSTKKAVLEKLYVRREHQGKGLGSEFLKEGFKELKERKIDHLCLICKKTNQAAIDFLLEHDFRRGYEFIGLEKF